MARHPSDENLALLAGGDCDAMARIAVEWHVRGCAACEEKVAEFRELRAGVGNAPLPELDWDRLGTEMRANIHLGMEAGECVREAAGLHAVTSGRKYPKLIFACAGAAAVLCVSIFLSLHDRTPAVVESVAGGTVLRTTNAGVQVRNNSGSLTLLNRQGAAPDRTAVSESAIRASYIDGESGKVTVTSVYRE